MSDHMLSQEEVDALLSGDDGDTPESLPDLEAVSRLFQDAFDRVAPLIPPIAGESFETGTVTAELLPWSDIRAQLMSPLIALWRYEGRLEGVQLSVADSSSRQQLRAYLDADDPVTVLNKLALALAEGLQQVMDSDVKPDIESYQEVDAEPPEELPLKDDDVCVALQMSLRGDTGDVSWLEVVPVALASGMLDVVAPADAEETGDAPNPTASDQSAAETAAGRADSSPVAVSAAEFAPLAPTPTEAAPANIGLIMDVPLHVTVELGRRRMLVRDVLDLGKGSLIELDKLAGEPVDVFVNGKLIAKGEVVVIDENFGVKVTSIVTPVERVRNLQ